MKIIKQGKKPDRSRKFTCRFCRCVFIAEKSEYSVVPMGYNTTGYECNCPNCGIDCFNEEVDNDVEQNADNSDKDYSKYLHRLTELEDSTDPEAAHGEADNILCEFLRSAGFEKMADAFEKVEKWYS